ncbi:MAG TPA: hypothetical protein VFS21_18770, partial [Roseiflexaceae bacterium]|nr:hypothetical protein [Roseiflexaceae bacterium]
ALWAAKLPMELIVAFLAAAGSNHIDKASMHTSWAEAVSHEQCGLSLLTQTQTTLMPTISRLIHDK